MGTPQYLAPEQARGLAVSPQTDVYSLGVMAYELFLEQLPFEAETAAEVMAMHLRAVPPPPRELWPDIPAELESLLLAMLAKPPDERPTMAEVARRLEAVRAELVKRRALCSRPPRIPTPAMPLAQPVLRRVRSSGGAPTEPYTWRSETRRWQYALGGLALAVSGLMFWISRAGDRAASAATTPAAITSAGPAPVVRALHPVEPSAVEPVAVERAAVEPLASAPEITLDAAPLRTAVASPGDLALRTAVAVEPVAPPTAPRARLPVPARAATRPASPPSSPAAPRLRAKVDPDGTLDVYR
jgi:serine/threonine-protein kinase